MTLLQPVLQSIFPTSGTAHAAGFTPSGVAPGDVPGLVAQYDFSDAASLTLESGSHIAGIVNKANPGTYDGAASGAARPTLVSNGMGGNTVGRFNGSQRLSTADIDLGTDFTVLAVFDMADKGDFNLIMGKGGNYFGGGMSGKGWVVTSDYHSNKYSHEGYGTNLMTIAREGADVDVGLNGGVSRVPTASAILAADSSVFGNIGSWNFSFVGDICEILLFDRRLEDSETKRLQAYLAEKWNLAQELDVPVIFDGNSIHQGVGTSNFSSDSVVHADTAYTDIPSRTRQALAWPDAVWRRYAVSGQTTPEMSADAATQLDPIVSPFRQDNILVVSEITNDLSKTPPFPTKEQAYERFVSYCQGRKLAGWKVVVWGVLPRSTIAEADRTWINGQMKTNWAAFADAYVDLSTVPGLFDEGDNSGALYADGIHPNDDGALAIAQAIAPCVARVRQRAAA